MSDTKKQNINEKLLAIQSELKVPKNQYNSFGKYKYRSCEDILEAVKPLCVKHKVVLTVTDEMVLIGDRYYVKAFADLRDIGSEVGITVTAYSREPLVKKGMDEPQITGTATSYARKYALNGLLCIDDTKDADSMGSTKEAKEKKTYKNFEFLQKMSEYKKQLGEEVYYTSLGIHGYEHANEIPPQNHKNALRVFEKKAKEMEAKP